MTSQNMRAADAATTLVSQVFERLHAKSKRGGHICFIWLYRQNVEDHRDLDDGFQVFMIYV